MSSRRAFLRTAAFAPVILNGRRTGAAAETAQDKSHSTTAGRTLSIDVWYGNEQTFGRIGNPQRWVNILGNVTPASGTALSYTLNGGTAQILQLGCDLRRLARAGDFNIELERSSLRAGKNEVKIIAVNAVGDRQESTVTVNYVAGRHWPLPYAIGWSGVARIHDVAEVVDGRWRIEAGGIRTVEPYYDRVIAIGDMSWTDYEVETSMVYHRFMATEGAPEKTPPFAGFGAAGLLFRWQGHHDDGKQPRVKWNPTGGLATLRGKAGPEGNIWTIHGGESGILARQQRNIRFQLGRKYLLKGRVETLPGPNSRYSAKAWDAAEPEPPAWDLVAVDGPQDSKSGSLLFVVHHSDVTIGNVSIAPLRLATPDGKRGQ